VKLLLQHGADVNAKTEWVLCTCVQLLQEQLTAAAAVQVTRFCSDSGTALHEAAAKNQMELVKLLLQHGADMNVKTKWVSCVQLLRCRGSWRLQHQAVQLWHNWVTRLLRLGGTALYAAAAMNHVEMVKLLLQRGADVNAKAEWVSYV